MTQVTPNYQWPTPDLTDSPDVPSVMSDMANAIEATVTDIDARAHTPRVVMGRLASPTFLGASVTIPIALPFQPQFVKIVTQVTNPMASSNAVATYSEGRLGFDSTGALIQDVTGIRIVPGSGGTAERRTLLNSCGGLMIDDVTTDGHVVGSINPSGFSLTFSNVDPVTVLTYFWTAWE